MVSRQRASKIASQPVPGDKGSNGYSANPLKGTTTAPRLWSSKFLEEKENARKRYGSKRTITWDELPEWMQENVWIRSGYRVPMYSYWRCLKSLFYLHNEWVNVWSHLIGTIIFSIFCFTTYYTIMQTYARSIDWYEITVFYCFLGGGIVCMGFSSLFHCFTCHSPKAAATWNRCDYIGIVAMIVGSFYPSVYYGFYCYPNLQTGYMVGITVLGGLTIVAAVMKRFRSPSFRWVRTILFLCLGLSAVIPAVHGFQIYGSRAADTMSLSYMVTMGTMYVVGALIYGWRVPERWWPGHFDIFGGSHQIFHFFVVGAAIVHYLGVVKAVRFWHDGGVMKMCGV